MKERRLGPCFVFGRVIACSERLAERLQVPPDGFCRMAQGQIQKRSAEPVRERFAARLCGGIVGDVKRRRGHFLIILIRLADRDIAQRPPRLADDFHEFGRFVGRKAVSEDIDPVVLRARF